MKTPDSETTSRDVALPPTGRRRFLGGLGLLSASIGLGRFALLPSKVPRRFDKPWSNVDRRRFVSLASSDRARRLAETFPIPEYIPAGYRLTRVTADMPQGFKNGLPELALVYHSSAGHPHVPLVVFIVLGDAEFTGNCREADGQRLQLRHVSGRDIDVVYFDGKWTIDGLGTKVLAGSKYAVSWTRNYLHTLVAHVGAYTLGVQAPVTNNLGIPAEDLFEIARTVPIGT